MEVIKIYPGLDVKAFKQGQKFKPLKLCKRNNFTQTYLKQYLRNKQNYKTLFKKQKKEVIDRACNVRNPTDFRQSIRSLNGSRYTRNSIDIDVWLECYRQVNLDVPYLGFDLFNRMNL